MVDQNAVKADLINDEKFKDATKFLDIDYEDLKDKALVSFAKDKELTNKVTSLKNMVLEYQMNLEGKTYDPEKGGYVQTEKALAGKEFIKLSSGILNSFAMEANLLTSKDKDTFIMQFKDAHEKVNLSLCMRNRAVPERTQRAILKMWKDTFWNISEIIINSKGNMEKVFGTIPELRKQTEGEIF